MFKRVKFYKRGNGATRNLLDNFTVVGESLSWLIRTISDGIVFALLTEAKSLQRDVLNKSFETSDRVCKIVKMEFAKKKL